MISHLIPQIKFLLTTDNLFDIFSDIMLGKLYLHEILNSIEIIINI